MEKWIQKLRRHIDSREGATYNLGTSGGSGKTFLTNLILSYVRMQHKIAIATVMSGIASTLLVLGTVLHKKFGVLIPFSTILAPTLKWTQMKQKSSKRSSHIIWWSISDEQSSFSPLEYVSKRINRIGSKNGREIGSPHAWFLTNFKCGSRRKQGRHNLCLCNQ